MTTLHTVSFQKTVLASLIGLCLSQSAFALQEISDKDLSQATGEGIAFLPENAYMIFQKADDTVKTTATAQADLLSRTLDTGYINYIPVGPLTTTATDTSKNTTFGVEDGAVGKADLFLYGLAISASNSARTNNHNERVGLNTDGTAVNSISSWGSYNNPWLFKVESKSGIPTFTPDVTTPSLVRNTATGTVTALVLEAPLYEYTYSGTTTPAQQTGPEVLTNGLTNDAYNLKLGLWADAFVRNPYVSTDNNTNYAQFKYGTATGLVDSTSGLAGAGTQDGTRANRLRLQGIMNGFSLNGSHLKVFQTLDGASSTNGQSKFYNKTLGASGIIRLNSGDSSALLGTAGSSTATKWQATTNRYSTVYLGQANAGATNHLSKEEAAEFRLRTEDTTIATTAATWTAPTNLQDKVLRLSTRETGSYDCASSPIKCLETPALNSALTAPVFDANEGIFIYNLNNNLVLGNLYQPVILGSDGKNFSLEIARIPNKANIYEQIYTDYSGTNAAYKGSTCNVYQCGTTTTLGGRNYQGSNATHSSISIGTVYSDDGGKTLKANNTAGAVGISFGKLDTTTIGASTKYYYQLQKQERQAVGTSWQYLQSDVGGVKTWGTNVSGCNGGVTNGDCYNGFNTDAPWISVNTFNQPCISTTLSQSAGCGNTATATINQANMQAGITNTLTGIQIYATNGTEANRAARTLVNLGYAPDAAHQAYTVGAGLGKMGYNQTNTPTGLWDYGYRTDVNIGTGKWTVAAWGGEAVNGTPTTTVQTDAQVIANIQSMYASSVAANNGADFYSGTAWGSNAYFGQFANLATSTAVTGAPAGMTIMKGTQSFNVTPLNNMGSAVIDGLLIQHLKITSKGL